MSSRILKGRVYSILGPSNGNSTFARGTELFLLFLIVLNVVAVILETVGDIATSYSSLLSWFETCSVLVFAVEYVLRIWSCTSSEQFHRPILGRIKYAVTFMAIIDLLSILPFFVPMLIPIDLRFLRALRLMRILRVLKFGRYSESFALLGGVLRDKRYELYVSLFFIAILLTLSSSLMYFFERAAQPEEFSSIPATMWWGIATLTTVGYGDVYPVTTFGKIFGAMVALFGIGLFALPAGILASGFSNSLRNKPRVVCQKCGHVTDDCSGQ